MKIGEWLIALQLNKSMDRFFGLSLLLVVTLVIQIFYAVYVRPTSEAWMASEQAKVNADPSYAPARSLLSIIHEPEPEASIIVTVWSLILAGLRLHTIKFSRRLIDDDLLKLPPGYCITPEDVRNHLRRFDHLPPYVQATVVPRVLQAAMKRFSATRDIQDASTTVHHVCQIESSRLDSELSTIRFTAWAIPAIGFVGTVRGLSDALSKAQFALNGTNPGALTGGLGLSFNSTFTALSLCIFVMFVYHELQLSQERLVQDAEQYAEDELISRLRPSTEVAGTGKPSEPAASTGTVAVSSIPGVA